MELITFAVIAVIVIFAGASWLSWRERWIDDVLHDEKLRLMIAEAYRNEDEDAGVRG